MAGGAVRFGALYSVFFATGNKPVPGHRRLSFGLSEHFGPKWERRGGPKRGKRRRSGAKFRIAKIEGAPLRPLLSFACSGFEAS